MSTSSRTYARRAAWLAAAIVATSLVAACGSAGPGQPAATATPGASESSAGTQPPATSPSSAPVPTSSAPAISPSNAAGLAACRTASLLITIDDSLAGGAAGSTYYPLNFTNTSAASCELYGYPGVSFVAVPAGTGAQIGVAAKRSSAFGKVTVRLAPGGMAHAWLQVTVAA